MKSSRRLKRLNQLEKKQLPDNLTGDQLEFSIKRPHWTVTELTSKLKSVVEPSFSDVWVQGEVSNLRPAASGHLYFSLKDSGATVSVAVFGWGSHKAKFEIKDGLQIFCHGKVSVYPPRGSSQLVADQIEPLGAGALQLAFDQLKMKLNQEGLFSVERKKALPPFPKKIVVITSPTGAAIQDMLNILKRRAPWIEVMVVPAVVQGEDAPRHLIRALEVSNRLRLGEIIVLARGGGSIEDLWCFNNENLARAIAASSLPVVSAVGHEIDFTISDFVSDLRAPTPSAAAEIISGAWVDAANQVRDYSKRLSIGVLRQISTQKSLLSHIAARLVSPRDRLRVQMQRLDEQTHRMSLAMKQKVERSKNTLQRMMSQLDALSPLRVLERGYSLVVDHGQNRVVRNAIDIQAGKNYELRFSDGVAHVQGK